MKRAILLRLAKIMFLLSVVLLCNAASCTSQKNTDKPVTKEVQLNDYFGNTPEPEVSPTINRGPDENTTDSGKEDLDTNGIKILEISAQKTSIVVGTTSRLRVLGITEDNRKIELTNQVVFETSSSETADFSPAIKGLLIGKKPGSVDVTASINDLRAKVTINVDDITIDKIEISPRSITVGSAQQFYATGFLSDGSTQDMTDAVIWTTANALILEPKKEVKNGVFFAHRAGKTNIGIDFNGRIANSAVDANLMSLKSISIETDSPSILFGTTVTMKAIGTFTNGTTADVTGSVNWKSLNTDLAKVSDELATKGIVSTLAAGSATISASFSNVTATSVLNITAVSFVSFHFEPEVIRIPKGKKEQIKVFGKYMNGSKQEITKDVIWQSNKPYLAFPSNLPGEEGLIDAYDVGDFSLSATYGATVVELNAEVTEATIVEITIDAGNLNVTCGVEKPKLKAEALYSDATKLDVTDDVLWTSNNEVAAIVSNAIESKGTVETLQPGAAKITASIVEPILNKTVAAHVIFSINQPILSGYEITSGFDNIAVGKSMQLYANGVYTCLKNPPVPFTNDVTWSISDLTYAEVLNQPNKGLLKTYGNVVTPIQINVTAKKDTLTASKQITIKPKEIVSISLVTIPSVPNIDVGTTKQVFVRALYSDTTTIDITDGSELTGATVSWSAAQPSFLTVNNTTNKGLVTGVSEGILVPVNAVLLTAEGTSFNGNILFSVRSPCFNGKRDGVYCWFLSNVGQSCVEACSAIGGDYLDADVSAIGSDGNSGSCTSVINRFGYSQLDRDDQVGPSGVGAGCALLVSGSLVSPRRYTSPATNGNEKHPNLRRFCSCRD